jgi:hypothetical protein
VPITTDVVSSYPVSSMSRWIGRVFEEEWWGAVTSPEMTSPEVVSPKLQEITSSEVTGNCITGSHQKWLIGSDVRGSVREIIRRAFFSPGFPSIFSSEIPRVNSKTFGSFPIGHSIFPAYISTNENLGNSTNEMPQSPFPLANHGSPYMSNESVCTIYFWPFVESLSFVQSNSNVNLCIFQFENRQFHSNIHSDRMCLSCGI